MVNAILIYQPISRNVSLDLGAFQGWIFNSTGWWV